MSAASRLVLIEGLPGTGKSTTAQFLALHAESAWLQWPIMALLRHDLPPEAILTVVGEIATLIVPLDPVLVYLSHPDVEAAVEAIGT